MAPDNNKVIGGTPVNDHDPLSSQEGGAVVGSGNTGASTAGNAVTLTFAATPGKRWRLPGIEWSISGTPAAAVALTVQDGSTVIWQADIVAGGPGFIPLHPPREGTINSAMTVTLAAAGGSLIGKVNAAPTLENP